MDHSPGEGVSNSVVCFVKSDPLIVRGAFKISNWDDHVHIVNIFQG